MDFFENGGGQGLQVFWSGPGVTKEVIPTAAYSLSPPIGCAAASAIVSISTFDAGGRPLQFQEGIKIPAIFSATGDGGEIFLSSYLAGAVNVTVNVSLIVAASIAAVPLKAISVAGLRFSGFNASAAPACYNLRESSVVVTVIMTVETGVLLLNFSAASTPILPKTPIVCSIAGFTNSMPASATASVSVSTFDATRGNPLQTQNGVLYPSIFQAVGNGAIISLSNYVADTTNVVLTVTFVVASAVASSAFKLISVAGLRFLDFNATAEPVSCSNLSPSTVTVAVAFVPSSGMLLLSLSAAATPTSSTTAIVCTVAGFRNQACAAQSGLSAKWFQYSSELLSLPSHSDFETWTPTLQGIVPNLNFAVVDDFGNGGMNAVSGGLLNLFAARFQGYECCPLCVRYVA